MGNREPGIVGFCYAAKNDSMPGMLKIGSTQDAERRIADMSRSTSIPLPFRLVGTFQSSYYRGMEFYAHRNLDAKRVSKSREFFYCDESDLNEVLGGFPEPKIDVYADCDFWKEGYFVVRGTRRYPLRETQKRISWMITSNHHGVLDCLHDLGVYEPTDLIVKVMSKDLLEVLTSTMPTLRACSQ